MKKTTFKWGPFIIFTLFLFLFLPALNTNASTIQRSADGVWQYYVREDGNSQIVSIDNAKYAQLYGSVANVTFPTEVDGYKVAEVYLYQGGLSLETEVMTLPEDIKEFDGSNFGFYPYETPRLTTINLPASVTTINNFECFDNLTTVNFAPNSQLEKIYSCAFEGMTTIRSFNFRQFSKLNWIGLNAFKGTSIETVDLGDNIDIDSSAFSDCPNLTSVSVGQNCNLNTQIFRNCPNLKTASFEDGCSMNYGTFENSNNLSSLELGNVKKLGHTLFTSTKIKKLTIPKSCTVMPYSHYDLVPKNVVLYVDKGSEAETYAKEADYKYEYISSAKTNLGKVTSLKVAKKSKSSIKVSWKKVNDASGYQIYLKTNSGSYKKAATIKKGSVTNYTVKKLKKNKTYTFKVRAYKTVDKETVYGSYSTAKKLKLK